jgi:hypothetical protein
VWPGPDEHPELTDSLRFGPLLPERYRIESDPAATERFAAATAGFHAPAEQLGLYAALTADREDSFAEGGLPCISQRQQTHKGGSMSTIFVRHQVADYDVGKPGFDEHGSVRREYGLTDAGLHRGNDDANDITIVLTTDDVARAQEFIGSDNLRETMGKLGVVSAPDVWITNDA